MVDPKNLSLFIFSRIIKNSPHQSPNDGLLNWLFRKVLIKSARTNDLTSLLIDALTKPTGKTGQNGLLLKQPCATVRCQLKFMCRMINQANRHPGHATYLSFIRSKPVAPFSLVKSHKKGTPNTKMHYNNKYEKTQ